jgi:uncharacterized protein with von Willebrand factor type A (vWA) domain
VSDGSPGVDDVDPDALVLGFVGALRAAGLPVSIHESITFAQALTVVGFHDRTTVRSAGRATLVKRVEHVATYDAVFDAYWRTPGHDPAGVPTAAPPMPAPAPPADAEAEPEQEPEPETEAEAETEPGPGDEAPADTELRVDDGDGAEPDRADAAGDEAVDDDAPPAAQVVRASVDELLRGKDFARYSAAERDEAHRLLADVRLLGAPRRSRRHRPRRRGGPGARVDLARTMRDARRHEGEVIGFRTTTPSTRPRRVVFLLDISGSMELYARPLLRLAQAGVTSRGRTRVEVFTLGTRLTRITRELTFHDPDVALARTAVAVQDWSGGTRLGANLRRFNDAWGTRGMARGATVVIVSDGWERDDPTELRDEMQRLGRVAHRIVWVNPLKASPGYEPLARGIAAALPFVDQFVEGHSLDALGDLVRVIAGGATARTSAPPRSGGTS